MKKGYKAVRSRGVEAVVERAEGLHEVPHTLLAGEIAVHHLERALKRTSNDL